MFKAGYWQNSINFNAL